MARRTEVSYIFDRTSASTKPFTIFFDSPNRSGELVNAIPKRREIEMPDTIICSYLDFDGLVEGVLRMEYVERPSIRAVNWLQAGEVYYIDLMHKITKYELSTLNEVPNE